MVSISNRDKDPKKKKLAREILASKHLPKMFKFLEELIKNNKKSPWFVGSKLTIADLAVWRLLGWLSSGKLDGVEIALQHFFVNTNFGFIFNCFIHFSTSFINEL